jgi:hypothetical protein
MKIEGSGSTPKCHGSATLGITLKIFACTNWCFGSASALDPDSEKVQHWIRIQRMWIQNIGINYQSTKQKGTGTGNKHNTKEGRIFE